MRFAKVGALAVALAGAFLAGTGVAQAEESVVVTSELLGCAAKASMDTSILHTVQPGQSVTISDELAAELRQMNCPM
ncbi:hypothetical protein NDR87_16495 [Nocardia sp. CDC159]|uniref:Secreted protein n=1 Tax=Nocardia pulmonis TaxID=2951408 RepID=A0A9X2E721_9NOCA|nr:MULTISPECIES: hypothetical protein [Nocardia]MCM6775307.1 hypothetical protein [Nocardia pulmonis]MCM6787959.1 hypothetical protein [Nocardia sp. CDC159]